MKCKIIAFLIMIPIVTNNVFAQSPFPDKTYPFKEPIGRANIQQSLKQGGLFKSNPVSSVKEYIYKILKLSGATNSVSAPATTFMASSGTISNTPPNSNLKTKGVKYDKDGFTDDLVYTGITYGDFIFPIDMRDDRFLDSPEPLPLGSGHPTVKNIFTVTDYLEYRNYSGDEWHTGLDMAGGVGENGRDGHLNIYAPCDGKLVHHKFAKSGEGMGGYGYVSVIEFEWNGKIARMQFAHLSKLNTKLKEGQTVKQGQMLGQIGGTGSSPNSYSYATHLHWGLSLADEYYSNVQFPTPWGTANNPTTWADAGKGYVIIDPLYLYGNKTTGDSYRKYYEEKLYLRYTSVTHKIDAWNVQSKYHQAPSELINPANNNKIVSLPTSANDIYKWN